MQKSSKWTLENGYDYCNPNDTEDYPYRYREKEISHMNFEIYIKTLDRDIDYLCSGAFDGYSITFHLPNEMPSIRKNVFYFSAKNYGKFWTRSIFIDTAPELYDYDPHLRQCFFNSEHKLRFYRQYTKNNCELECLVNFTHSRCGCVHFAMPSKEPFTFTSIINF